jgi:hypothetical protein
MALAFGALGLTVVLAACGSSVGPSSPGTSGSSSPSGSAASPAGESASPPGESAAPSPPPSSSPSSTTAARPTPNAFWTAVRAGLSSAGHLVATAKGASPVVLRFLPDASEALVAGDPVSICVGGTSYQGAGGHFTNVPGTWLCGVDALVTGFRATGGAIDAWNPDFPPGGTVSEKVTVAADGRWHWAFAGRGTMEGDVDASLVLDPATQRLVGGSRTGELGRTTFAFDYATAVAPIAKPAI